MSEPKPLTLDEILSVPGNRAAFDALVDSLRDGEAIAFVGAGASAGMYPLWGEFINLLADHTVVEGMAEPKDAARWKADTTSTPQQRVNVILRRLGEPRYRNFLRKTFGPPQGTGGSRYTATHAALMRLPFRGYVTTNYDPALEFARMDLRPESRTTGTPTWRDDDEVYRWHTGDIFREESDCPILWLHGYWQRPNDIVLNSGEYAAAYKPGLYRRLFDGLWGQRRLAFAGFGFNDPQFTFMVGEYLRDLKDANAPPRHVAILSMDAGVDGRLPDPDAAREWRDNLETDYHVRPLFYPARGRDHSALRTLLDAVAEACGCALPAPTVAAVPTTKPTPVFSSKWFHEPTNDDKFVGREDELARLDRWVRDEAVRAVGVSAVGGTGKTALVGRWLRETEGWRTRPFEGLFAWSFYQNRASADFLLQLLLWAHEALGVPKPTEKTDIVDAALDLARRRPLVFVLDGLEVLQEGPEEARHGAFLDGALREFLSALCQRQHRSLAVLTSRFVFADLERFLGTAFHQLELHGLPPEQGAGLLEDLHVSGGGPEREYVSHQLDGHPLGLRVFADALPDEDREQPRRFLAHAFRPDQLPEGAPLNDKLRRLLVFYEKRLPTLQTRLLSVVALFRTPVPDETVLHLARGLFGEETEAPLPDNNALAAELKRLQARGILSREPIEGGHGSACHPILRDHFRAVLLGARAGTARRAADLILGAPSWEQPRSEREIEPIIVAIDLLTEAGSFQLAHSLVAGRLVEARVFKWLALPRAGYHCTQQFLTRSEGLVVEGASLSPQQRRFYLHKTATFAGLLGDFELSLRYREEADKLARELYLSRELTIGKRDHADILIHRGDLAGALAAACESLAIAHEQGNRLHVAYSAALASFVELLLGRVGDAFARIKRWGICSQEQSGALAASGIRGIQLAETLLLSGMPRLAESVIGKVLSEATEGERHADLPRALRIQVLIKHARGEGNGADEILRGAERGLRAAGMVPDLGRLMVTMGSLALARRDAATALHQSAEALTLAAPRGMRLVHADSLVLRGRANMLEGYPENVGRALDDAEEALRLARECGYAWAERDGLFLKAETHAAQAAAHQASGNEKAAAREQESSRRARAEAEAVAAKLVLTEADLATAKTWLKNWEETGAEE
ncbi:MAG: SIR2 family protein [Acidobacteria bacterium]|nr:SIR2 family protein [Acidobacteriota bacterium]